jgi:hypothetical protein
MDGCCEHIDVTTDSTRRAELSAVLTGTVPCGLTYM